MPSRAWSTRRPSGSTRGEPHRRQVVEFFSSDHFQQVGQQTASGAVAATTSFSAEIVRRAGAVLGRCHVRDVVAANCQRVRIDQPTGSSSTGGGSGGAMTSLGGGMRGNLVSATTIRKDERCAATLARHHRPQFRPFPAGRAADFYNHRSFSARPGREADAVRGRCRDRDRFSADRDRNMESPPVSRNLAIERHVSRIDDTNISALATRARGRRIAGPAPQRVLVDPGAFE